MHVPSIVARRQTQHVELRKWRGAGADCRIPCAFSFSCCAMHAWFSFPVALHLHHRTDRSAVRNHGAGSEQCGVYLCVMCVPQGHGTNASALCRGSNACMHDRVGLPAVHLIDRGPRPLADPGFQSRVCPWPRNQIEVAAKDSSSWCRVGRAVVEPERAAPPARGSRGHAEP